MKKKLSKTKVTSVFLDEELTDSQIQKVINLGIS
jgi:hypothetical protein